MTIDKNDEFVCFILFNHGIKCPRSANKAVFQRGRDPGGGGGGGGYSPQHVPRQSEKWVRAPERTPGRAWKCGLRNELVFMSRFERENANLRNELDPFWKCQSPERPRTRGAAERFVFGLSRPCEALNGLKLKKFWKWWSPERENPPKNVKWWCSGTDFFGNLWKLYAPELKFRAENWGLSRGTYPICIHMEVPPPPPGGGGGAVNTVITTKTYEQINEIYNKTRTITQKYQTQIKQYTSTHYTVRIKIKVIHIQRPIVLKSNDLKICMWHIRWRATHPISIGTFLASGMSRMTEYIAIEDDNVMTHFLQVLTIG